MKRRRKQQNGRWKVWAAVLLILCFCMSAFVSGAAETGTAEAGRVFDMADLFSEEETRQLEEKVSQYQETVKMDLVVVTTEDAGGKTAQEYADDFYDAHDFGRGSKKSGALFLIDMDNRELYISTSGDMIRFLTDSRLDTMLDHIYEKAVDNDFAACADVFLEDVKTYVDQGIQSGQYNYDTETGEYSVYRSIRWYEALLALGVAAVTAGIACFGVLQSYAMKEQQRKASGFHKAYRENCHFAFGLKEDLEINSFVTSRRIQTQSHGGSGRSGGSSGSRSSTHRSSSGRSHGGGGRRF